MSVDRWLFRWEKLGGHIHVDVFAGTELQANNGARPRLGTLVVDEDGWAALQQLVGLDFGHPQHVTFKERVR